MKFLISSGYVVSSFLCNFTSYMKKEAQMQMQSVCTRADIDKIGPVYH